MIPLTITIPFWRFTRTIFRSAPRTWNELTHNQLIKLAGIIFQPEEDKNRMRIKITKLLFGLRWYHIFAMSPVQLAWLNTFFDFVLEKNALTDNKFLTICAGRQQLYGPIGDFSTLKGKEWTHAAEAFREYIETNDPDQLDLLIAILWRPKNKKADPKSESWADDYRISYNQFTAERRAKRLAKVDQRIKMAILIWYRGCWEEWEEIYARIFSATGEQVENYGWAETMQKLTGTTFGSLNEAEESLMWKLLLKMEIDLKDQEIQDRKSKK